MNIAKSTLPAETGDLRNICANPTGWPDTFLIQAISCRLYQRLNSQKLYDSEQFCTATSLDVWKTLSFHLNFLDRYITSKTRASCEF